MASALLSKLPHLPPRARKILRVVGLVVLFLITFVFALQWTFPFSRVKDKITEVLSAKYEVDIREVERGLLPGRVYFKAVTLRTRPAKADDVPTTFYIESLQVDVGLFALIGSKASIDIDAKIGSGHITGNIALSKSNTSIHLAGDGVPSQQLPMREAIGLPMSGKVTFALDLELPNSKLKTGKIGPNWQKASGGAKFACPSGCTFGDGKTKLKPKLKNTRNQAFAEGGIEFGKLNVSSLVAKVEIGKGKFVVKQFDTKSEDGELHVEYSMELAQNIDESDVTGCLRFTGSDALLKRDARTHAAISTTGAPLGPDNLYHIKLDGRVKEMKRLGVVCGTAAGPANGAQPGDSARPTITVQPTEPPPPPPADAAAPTFTPPTVTPDPGINADAAVTVPVPGPEHEHPSGSGSAVAAPNEGAAPGSAAPAGSANPVPEGMR